MAQHTRIVAGDVVRINTSFDYPPIPVRNCDWSAVTDDYEAWTEDGEWTTTHPAGHGATEEEAIADLLIQIEDRAEERHAHSQFGVGA